MDCIVLHVIHLFQIASVVLCEFVFRTSEIAGLKFSYAMNQQMQFYNYVQSRIIIPEQHVSATPVTISRASYNKNTIYTYTVYNTQTDIHIHTYALFNAPTWNTIGFKNLFSCIVKLHLRDTNALITYVKKKKML
jgi:hypothetical protein